MFILSADIGGTTARFGIYDENYMLAEYKKVKTKNITSFKQTLRTVFEEFSREGYIIQVISIGVAGPVRDEKVELTNTNLSISKRALTNIPVEHIHLLNDVEAYGYGVTQLEDYTHITGPKQSEGVKAVLTVGTGVGKALITPQNPPLVLPSEGGHIDPPYTFIEYIKKQKEQTGIAQVTIEDILGGEHIVEVNKILTGREEQPEEILENEENEETKKLMQDLLVSTSRNYALTTNCTGGLYLGGGVIQKHPSLLNRLNDEFSKHRTHQGLLENIPVYSVDNPKTGLKGAAVYATYQ